MSYKKFAMAGALVVVAGFGGAACAADYPERPIQMIVPWGAGGGSDAVARIIASVLQEDLGQPVNVVNRTGGRAWLATQQSLRPIRTVTRSVLPQWKSR